ncbi:MAG: hypothetical protein OEV91_10370, partial [Desulfobulbaceae bacterium]|nr:hypothetical protein [Desulfobulbaceae bacterium]
MAAADGGPAVVALPLATIVNDREQLVVEGYVRERDLSRLSLGGVGRFYPEHTEQPSLDGVVTALDKT